jgi:2-amino-4-hydroxy-6-hydroxymethyldihydropteridine diphosphokinase
MEGRHRVAIILGSNIDKEHNLPAAVRLLAQAAPILAVSTVYETAAAGRPEQPSYFNAAVLLQTGETAAALKDGLLDDIERRLGRRRTADKYAARTIDLDIVLYDDEVFDYTPRGGRVHHIPDPDLLTYAHCAVPVAELLPGARHPETAEPLSAISARLLAMAEPGNIFRPRPDVDLNALLGDGPATQ